MAGQAAFSAGNPVISGISVEGNVVVDAATIVSISGLRVGQELNPRSDEIPQGIKALWARKQFSDVRIVVDRVTPLGLFLRIEVKENPRFDRVVLEGNKKVSEKSLLDSVKKSRGDLFPYSDAQAIGRAIRQLYHKEGLLFAAVSVDTASSETPGYVKLLVRIDEGREYRIGSLTFIGNENVNSSVLLSQVEDSGPSEWWQFWKSSKFDTMKVAEDVKRVEAYYKNNGYLNAVVRTQGYTLDEKEGKANVTVSVNEGSRFFVRTVTFEGSTVYVPEYLKQRLDIKPGSPVNVERIEKNLSGNEEQSDIRSLYLDNGFLQAQIQHAFEYVSADSVDVKVQIFERDQFTIRRVDVVGNTKTQDRVVRRELFTYPGEYFNRGSIIRSIKGLGVLNYFNPEKLRPDVRPVSQNTVDLVYNVEERSTDMLNASV
ncbi:MAG: outer membrane protein assembly factor, partial [Candidatus Kapaibacterium sp.]